MSPGPQAMADHVVQRDFLWLLSFKGGTECERGQLLGQDLIKDLEASKGICQQLRTQAESMKTDKMTKVFRSFMEEISDMSKSVSSAQRELQEICQKMRWPSGTTKIAENLGHAILETEILPRFREYLQDSRSMPIHKHQIVVSARYLPLLEKLMAERLTGERQPKLSSPTRVELFLAAKRLVSRAGYSGTPWVESCYDSCVATSVIKEFENLWRQGFLQHPVVQLWCQACMSGRQMASSAKKKGKTS